MNDPEMGLEDCELQFIEICCNSFGLSTVHILEVVAYWLAHKSVSMVPPELWKQNPPPSGGGIAEGMV